MRSIKNQYSSFGTFHSFFQTQKCSFFNNFCRIWLVNELILTFLAPIKYAIAQFNLINLSRFIEYTTYIDRR